VKYYLIFILSAFTFISCNNPSVTNNCKNELIYLNSFENYNDVLHIHSGDSSLLFDESSSPQGKKSLKLCSCCNNIINIINLPVITRAGEYQLLFWAKKNVGANYATIKLLAYQNRTYSTFFIRDSAWIQYSSTPIYFEANTEPRINFYAIGLDSICILLDNLEFKRLN
jgi:hypothetical protein